MGAPWFRTGIEHCDRLHKRLESMSTQGTDGQTRERSIVNVLMKKVTLLNNRAIACQGSEGSLTDSRAACVLGNRFVPARGP
jgi:hypothetical protein